MKKKFYVMLLLVLFALIAIPLTDIAEATPIDHSHDSFTATSALTTGGTLAEGSYVLQSDTAFANGSDITIAAGETVNICLNGHSLTTGVVTVNGTLNVYDCQGTGTWTFAGSSTSYIPGIVVNNSGKLNIYGGTYTITDSFDQDVPMIESYGELMIKDTTIIGANKIFLILSTTKATLDNCTIKDKEGKQITYVIMPSQSSTLGVVGELTIKDCTFDNGMVWSHFVHTTITNTVLKSTDLNPIYLTPATNVPGECYTILEDVTCDNVYVSSGVELKIKGNNKIGVLNLSVKNVADCIDEVNGVKINLPKTVKIIGELTNETPIGIYIPDYEALYQTATYTEADAISGFDTYMAGKDYTKYFKSSHTKMPIYIDKIDGEIYLNKLILTKDATNSDQSVTVNASNATYQWYKVKEKEINIDDSYASSGFSYGTYDSSKEAWLLDDSVYPNRYLIYNSFTFTNCLVKLRAYIPKDTVMKSMVVDLSQSQSVSYDYWICSSKPFSLTLRVAYNGTWEDLIDTNSASGSFGTYENGVWNAEWSDTYQGYVIGVKSNYDNLNSGTLQFEATAKDDIVLDEQTSVTNATISFFIPFNAPIKLTGTTYDYTIDTGNTSATNNPKANGLYLCRASYKGASVESTAVTVTGIKLDPSYTVPTGLKAYVGDKLSSITLPEGFSFQDNLNTVLNTKGEKEVLLTYTPSDTNTYNVVTNIKAKITVLEKQVTPDPTSKKDNTSTQDNTTNQDDTSDLENESDQEDTSDLENDSNLENTSEQETEPTPEPVKKNHTWMYIVGAGLLVVIFFIIFFIKRDDDDDEDEEEENENK